MRVIAAVTQGGALRSPKLIPLILLLVRLDKIFKDKESFVKYSYYLKINYYFLIYYSSATW